MSRWLGVVAFAVGACGRVGFVERVEVDAEPEVTYVDAVLADSPLAYWRLDEADGSVAIDRSGHGNDATFQNCERLAASLLASDPDPAITLDGSTSSVVAPPFPFSGQAAFSLEAWVNIAAAQNIQHILNDELPSGARQGYALLLRASLMIELERFVDGVNVIAIGPRLVAGRPYHIVGTYDGVTLALYIDGALAATTSDTRSAPGTTDPFYIGANETVKFFNGTIDEVAVYDHALAPSRIAAHYRSSGR